MIRFEIFAGFGSASGDCTPATVARNRSELIRLADECLPGYTLTETLGRWNGKPEPSAVITYLGGRADKTTITRLAGLYKDAAEQESVLIVETTVNADFV